MSLPFDAGALPAQLRIDTSDRSRGIRITLDSLLGARVAPVPVDCCARIDENASLRSLDYVVVDVETTGGPWSRGHRITEFAAVRVRGSGEVAGEYHTLINPQRPIPPVITALTRISWEMVRAAPTFSDVAADVASAISGAVFVAHNAPFDWHILGAELNRTGRPLTGRTLCTVRLARRVVPEIRGRSLDALSYFFNVPNAARHRAWGDADATARIFARLLDRLDDLEVSRWHELEALLRRRGRRKLRRRANPHAAQDVEP